MAYRVREKLHQDLLMDLMVARGFTTEADQQRFLTPDFSRDSHDPYLLPDMGIAVERILKALKDSERIAVWSDYDCDGIPGGVLLVEFLQTIGLSVSHYIPHRHKEGYGLNEEGLAQLAREGVTLIITVDLGITDVEAVLFARSKNIDVIITDHHLVSGSLPEAIAIINPKRLDNLYPFDGLCGAGVAWKLVQALLVQQRFGVPEGQEKWLLDLVGLATLSDMVPLVGENRMLARYGLIVMKRSRRPGFVALLKLLRMRPSTLTEDDVGFMIAPRINAASRMDAPETAARLLATRSEEEAYQLARTLQSLNDERKILVATTVKEANKRIQQSGNDTQIIVMGNPSWRPGILGLVANSLMQIHKKPVFLWGREGGETLRGSCRSDGSVNVVSLMSAARDMFDDFGGHYASGGFALSQDGAPELGHRLEDAYKKIQSELITIPEITIERELSLPEVKHAYRTLSQLAPFGQGNSKPLFSFPNISISQMRSFGKGSDHLEVMCTDGTSQVSGMSFFATPESFTKTVQINDKADIIGHIELDWKGSVRIRVIDIV